MTELNTPFEFLKSQWKSPNDVTSLLLVVGGDVVQRALAQLSGEYLVPVAFSFGWVSYAVGALNSAFGDGKLMPPGPDCPSILVSVASGFSRTNNSWILGRILRDIEHQLSHVERGLSVSVFRTTNRASVKRKDWLWYSGIITIHVQLIIAALPAALHWNWAPFLITICGTVLALAGGALPQWKLEKWACRPQSPETYALTRGNGHLHVIIVQSNGIGLNLEDLATGRVVYSPLTRPLLSVLAIAWIALLISCAGLRKDSWYLLAIGFIGMAQNFLAAGSKRDPRAFGVHLEFLQRIEGDRVMDVLMRVENEYSRVGASLLKVFFPGELREHEEKFWDEKRALWKALEAMNMNHTAPTLALSDQMGVTVSDHTCRYLKESGIGSEQGLKRTFTT